MNNYKGGSTVFYGTFNARNIPPEEVAKSFVKNKEFDELLTLDHVVLMGARGCGKTTMFKMLTLPALQSWKSLKAKALLRDLPFYAVYIPTDIHWSIQANHIEQELSRFPYCYDKVSKGIITSNIYSSLCQTFREILTFEQNTDIKKEINLCKILIKEWLLPPTRPYITDIEIAISSRVSLINQHINLVIDKYKRKVINSDTDIGFIDDNFYFLDFMPTLTTACLAFDIIFKNKKRWALCFDELELAPQNLQSELFLNLRSTNQKFIFKLSASPIVKVSDTKAQPGHDVKLIRMWPHRDITFKEFSKKIIEKIFIKNNRDIHLEKVFGHSKLYSKSKKELEYKKGSETWMSIKKLAETDAALKELLIYHKIDPDNPVAINKDQLDQVLRKIKPTVLFRLAYRKHSSKGNISRSRKTLPHFNGIETLIDIAEGNPRWLIGIANDFLKQISLKPMTSKLDENIQGKIFQNISKRFYAFTTASPDAFFSIDRQGIYLKTILDKIGNRFHENVVFKDFPLDPIGTFVVDYKDIAISKLLEYALFQGAIVLLDPSNDTYDSNIYGKRFRLTYLLAPYYKIPLRTYNSAPLSKWLSQINSLYIQEKFDFLKNEY